MLKKFNKADGCGIITIAKELQHIVIYSAPAPVGFSGHDLLFTIQAYNFFKHVRSCFRLRSCKQGCAMLQEE